MKTIELLLLETIENLGIVGDVVKVRPGYARNYLLPRGLAQAPSQGAIDRLAARRSEVEAELKQLAERQKALIAKLEGYELTLERSATEQGVLYGGVTQHEIAQGLREAGFAIEDRYVRLGEQIKRLDSYQVPVVINRELKAEIKLWVVSDKPLENEEKSGASSDAAQAAAE